MANAYAGLVRQRDRVLQAIALFSLLFGAGVHFQAWTDQLAARTAVTSYALALPVLVALSLGFSLWVWTRGPWGLGHTLGAFVIGALGVVIGVQGGEAVGAVQSCLGGMLVGAGFAGLPAPWLGSSPSPQRSPSVAAR